MLALLHRIQDAGIFSSIRTSAYAYPVLLWLHVITLSAWTGLMLLTSLRTLRFGSPKPDATIAEYRLPKRMTFAMAAIFGVLLFGAKASQYSYNPWFWAKMGLLLLLGAVSFSRPGNRLAASLGLFLLIGTILVARGPATIRDLMHAAVDPSAEYLFDSVQILSDERGITEIAPHTDEDWRQVRARADVLLRMPDLLAAPGRRAARPRDRAANPEVELETEQLQTLLQTRHDDFALRARKLHDAAAVVMQAIDAKDKDALLNALNGIDLACEGCHVRYWYPNDKRAVQGAKEAGILE
jgi:hypothetical protein